PSSVGDFQALIDYQARMNQYYPDGGDIAADFYYVNNTDWGSRQEYARDIYVWSPGAENDRDWTVGYEKIFYANVVLDGIDNASLNGLSESDRQHVKGAALFIRGWTLYHLAQLFAPPYDPADRSNEYGLPLRLTPDINEPTLRAAVGDTHRQIETDLKDAAYLLPPQAVLATRPSKAAAYAALSRLYLVMGSYTEAQAYADSCLAIQPELMDYNDLDTNQANSFRELNPEVIFHATVHGLSGILDPTFARADTTLYQSYHKDDLRRSLFFDFRNDGSLRFRGSYYGSMYYIFCGLATDEVYLTKAECLIREGAWRDGVNVLEELLLTRWRKGAHLSLSINSAEDALRTVLDERRKELAFRGGVRWADLRRLNGDERFATTLTRRINDNVYTLRPGDAAYTFLIPSSVMTQSDIRQNPR